MGRLINLVLVLTVTAATSNAAEPMRSTFSLIASDLVAPATIHVSAVDLPLAKGTCLTAKYDWDFGDPHSKYNRLSGFSAAHTLDAPGGYTVSLTVTDEAGAKRRFTQTVVVRASRGPTVHVARAGNDRNDGASPATAVRSIARAMALAGNGSRVLLRRGEKFVIPGSIRIRQRNLVIGAYGPAVADVIRLPQFRLPSDNPEIVYAGARDGAPIIETTPDSLNVLVEDVTFDSVFNRDAEKKNMPAAARPTGTNFTMRRCVLLNVGDGINANAAPAGVLMQDCVAPLATGLRSYLAWIEGSDQAYIGNVAVNSTREAVMRVGFGGAQRVLITGNDFANLDRTDVDRIDIAKNALTVHFGKHIYVAGNTFRSGPVMVGPLGEKDGVKQKASRLEWVVFESNRLHGAGLRVNHGMAHLVIRNNRFNAHDRWAINIEGFNKEYNRGSSDLTVVNNTAVNAGKKGNFLRIGGRVDDIRVLRNLYVAPNLAPGSDLTAVIYLGQKDLSGISEITGNVWPVTRPQPFAGQGMFYLWPTWSDERGYVNLARWNELTGGSDRQADVELDNALRPTKRDESLVGIGAQE